MNDNKPKTNKFVPKLRDYEIEKIKYKQNLTSTNENPLLELNKEAFLKAEKKEDKIINKILKRKTVVNDPLTLNITEKNKRKYKNNSIYDYISKSSNKNKSNTITKEISNFSFNPVKNELKNKASSVNYSLIFSDAYTISDNIEDNWNTLKKNIITLFCSNENLIVKSLVPVNMDEDEETLSNQYKISKGRTRLDELDKPKSKNSTSVNGSNNYDVLTSGEYVQKLEALKNEMLQKWQDKDKVGSIKIIIHCTKILNDVSTPNFYCHKFLNITEILENFSNLIYERIFELAFPDKALDAKNNNTSIHNKNFIISPSIVNSKAKDICSNWIYKCCCIRELLPRIYIDIVFLKINRFLKLESEIEEYIISIARKIAGISHPLISFYLSAFFTKTVLLLYPNNKDFILFLLELLIKYKLDDNLIKKFKYENISIYEFRTFVEPCVEWLIYCLSKNVTYVSKYIINFLKLLFN